MEWLSSFEDTVLLFTNIEVVYKVGWVIWGQGASAVVDKQELGHYLGQVACALVYTNKSRSFDTGTQGAGVLREISRLFTKGPKYT